ncbi:MAG TPA: hypothetical protein VFI31_00650, partial [Pirellulales bacterium]|nr:hypothetical protein [Pirellulales bacterium]
ARRGQAPSWRNKISINAIARRDRISRVPVPPYDNGDDLLIHHLSIGRALGVGLSLFICWLTVCGFGDAQEVKIRGHASRTAKPAAAEQPSPPGRDEKNQHENSSPRGMLELLGAAGWLDRASDGEVIPPEGDELLWRSLYAVRRFSLLDIDRWSKSGVTPRDILDAPENFRGEMVAWRGTVFRVARYEPPAEAAERFDLPGYYRCEMEVGEERDRVIVYALAVPKTWRSGDALDERAGVKGLFTVLAGGEGESSTPVLIARRLAWYPPTPLGDLGMDVGLFDEISSRPGLTADDRECFYQLLAAVERVGTKQLFRAVPPEGRKASVEPLFNKPQSQFGRLVDLTGTARQAVLRRVEDPDIVARFGIDHFYEMQVFTPDSQDNPLTFCVRELPKGFPQGDRITESVRLAGFFFKKWGYRSSSSAQPEKPGVVLKQLAPLLIGREPVWIEPEPVDQRFANGVFLVLFVVMTVVVWLVVARLSRSDDRFHKQVAERFTVAPLGPRDELSIENNLTADNEAAPSSSDEELNEFGAIQQAEPESAEKLREITVREFGDLTVSELYRLRQRRYVFTGLELAILVLGVVALRVLYLFLRHA